MICRLCKSNDVELVIDFGNQPIVHELQRIKKIYKKYPLRLGCCKKCDFLQLMDCLEPEILYQNYFTLSGWKNQPHEMRTVEIITHLTGVNQKSEIFEIGCNDGSFLSLLKGMGYENISGVEPTEDSYQKAKKNNLEVKKDFFTKEFVHKNFYEKTFNIVITRMVLEHIIDFDDFIESVNYILKDNGTFIIEVPDTNYNLEMLDYALWEEHVNYFTLNTLNKLLKRHGFRIIHSETTLFSGKALLILCEKNDIIQEVSYRTLEIEKINYYKYSWSKFNKLLRNFLEQQNKKIAIYGCGARSSTFLNFTDIGDYVELFIDDQEEKQNCTLPGSDLMIKPWDNKYKNYVILLGVNTENEYKVINKRKLNIEDTYSILPPSSLIPDFWKEMYNDSF